MITDELARNRDGWQRRANELLSLAEDCRRIEAWDSPTGDRAGERIRACAEGIRDLAACADDLARAFDLHLQVVSVGGRLQI